MSTKLKAYRSTLTSLDLLLRALDRMHAKGLLPDDEQLDQAITGAAFAVGLGRLHFPDFGDELAQRSGKKVKPTRLSSAKAIRRRKEAK